MTEQLQEQGHEQAQKTKKKRSIFFVQMLMTTIREYRGNTTAYEIAKELGVPMQPIYNLDKPGKAVSADNMLQYLVWAYKRWPDMMNSYIDRLNQYKSEHDQEQFLADLEAERERQDQAEKSRIEREKKAIREVVKKEVKEELEPKMQEEFAVKVVELTAQVNLSKRQTAEEANQQITKLNEQHQALIKAAVEEERQRNEAASNAVIESLTAQFDEYKRITQITLDEQSKCMNKTNELMEKLIENNVRLQNEVVELKETSWLKRVFAWNRKKK